MVAVAALLAPLLVLGSSAAQDGDVRPTHYARADAGIIVRTEPLLASEPVGLVEPLTPLAVLEERDDGEGTAWRRVLTADGTTGWIRATDLAPLPVEATVLPATGVGSNPGGTGAPVKWTVLALAILAAAGLASRGHRLIQLGCVSARSSADRGRPHRRRSRRPRSLGAAD